MSRQARHDKLVAIVGPTASGKTALALRLAQRFNGEIICADSRTVYRGLDIGTAKPTAEERGLVPHHLLDVVEPGEPFTAARFKELAQAAIDEIQSKGKVPFLVGGTGLYVDAVLYDYQFPAETDLGVRPQLEALPTAELQRRVDEAGIGLNASDYANRRRLVRALETVGQPRGRSAQLRPQTLVIGMTVNKEDLHFRISERIGKALSQGLLDEVSTLINHYGAPVVETFGIAYKAFAGAVLGTKDFREAIDQWLHADLDLAKRQLTWFKRNHDIHGVEPPEEAVALVERFLDSSTPQ